MMNFARGDVDRLARLGPHTDVRDGLVPRIHPLRSLPEKEVLLYSMLEGLPFSHSVCPYYADALRNEYRSIIDQLEDRTPGTRFSLLASYDAIRPMLRRHLPSAELRACACGEPCIGDRCMACAMLDELREK